MRKAFIAAGAALALATPLSALAQAKPEVLVKQRQAAMTLRRPMQALSGNIPPRPLPRHTTSGRAPCSTEYR